MCDQGTTQALNSFQGSVMEKDCKINWETTTVSGQPAVKLTFSQNKKRTTYKIEPEPEKPSRNYYEKLVQAAVHKAGLDDPEKSFPTSILNVSLSGKTYNLHKG